ncbi:nucleotidyl transferase AbiEii/AbiGii toxin family protein [Parafilimonas sp.]|uniref:nucleotidyl transferase AbiEii/AbiGii toxin family protein n=1 Tax=Parafilimonas sp. TaxID=1969739 RepID=UPI0039E2BB24
MLQQNATPPATLELLKRICSLDELKLFGLGGGTNLALRTGHRISIDLDFFTNSRYDTAMVFSIITQTFPSAELLFEQNQTIMFMINNVKVDFVLYPFPWLQLFDIIESIRLISVQDIIPMKLQAVSNRNAKKDYWDIATLLRNYPLEKMLNIFSSKFPQVDIGFIIHSLINFENADMEPDPDTINNVQWNDLKHALIIAVKKYTNSLL